MPPQRTAVFSEVPGRFYSLRSTMERSRSSTPSPSSVQPKPQAQGSRRRARTGTDATTCLPTRGLVTATKAVKSRTKQAAPMRARTESQTRTGNSSSSGSTAHYAEPPLPLQNQDIRRSACVSRKRAVTSMDAVAETADLAVAVKAVARNDWDGSRLSHPQPRVKRQKQGQRIELARLDTTLASSCYITKADLGDYRNQKREQARVSLSPTGASASSSPLSSAPPSPTIRGPAQSLPKASSSPSPPSPVEPSPSTFSDPPSPIVSPIASESSRSLLHDDGALGVEQIIVCLKTVLGEYHKRHLPSPAIGTVTNDATDVGDLQIHEQITVHPQGSATFAAAIVPLDGDERDTRISQVCAGWHQRNDGRPSLGDSATSAPDMAEIPQLNTRTTKLFELTIADAEVAAAPIASQAGVIGETQLSDRAQELEAALDDQLIATQQAENTADRPEEGSRSAADTNGSQDTEATLRQAGQDNLNVPDSLVYPHNGSPYTQQGDTAAGLGVPLVHKDIWQSSAPSLTVLSNEDNGAHRQDIHAVQASPGYSQARPSAACELLSVSTSTPPPPIPSSTIMRIRASAANIHAKSNTTRGGDSGERELSTEIRDGEKKGTHLPVLRAAKSDQNKQTRAKTAPAVFKIPALPARLLEAMKDNTTAPASAATGALSSTIHYTQGARRASAESGFTDDGKRQTKQRRGAAASKAEPAKRPRPTFVRAPTVPLSTAGSTAEGSSTLPELGSVNHAARAEFDTWDEAGVACNSSIDGGRSSSGGVAQDSATEKRTELTNLTGSPTWQDLARCPPLDKAKPSHSPAHTPEQERWGLQMIVKAARWLDAVDIWAKADPLPSTSIQFPTSHLRTRISLSPDSVPSATITLAS